MIINITECMAKHGFLGKRLGVIRLKCTKIVKTVERLISKLPSNPTVMESDNNCGHQESTKETG